MARSAASRVILIGPMGSGKTTVARLLAGRLGLPALDLDEQIEQQAGCTVAQIFQGQGEAAFRQLESVVLRDALRRPCVLSCGGGIVTQAQNRRRLRAASRAGGLVVYLRAQPGTLATRIRRQPGKRPLIDGDGAVPDLEQTRLRVEELLQQRARHYEGCADLIVDTDGMSPDAVAGAVEQKVNAMEPGMGDGPGQ